MQDSTTDPMKPITTEIADFTSQYRAARLAKGTSENLLKSLIYYACITCFYKTTAQTLTSTDLFSLNDNKRSKQNDRFRHCLV